ncbi:TPA: hypothetical protein DDZ06_03040 [Candidatus Uhrbacteria bacterium]|nr:hypothetical protein [Candidatus Uhrbacteria bacterium]
MGLIPQKEKRHLGCRTVGKRNKGWAGAPRQAKLPSSQKERGEDVNDDKMRGAHTDGCASCACGRPV